MWILHICTAGWIMCGSVREFKYETEKQCYAALDELYKRQPATDFKYVVCKPKE
jgi:hypothetical protein